MLELGVRVTYEVLGGGRVLHRDVSIDPYVQNFIEITRGAMNWNYIANLCRVPDGLVVQARIVHPRGLTSPMVILGIMGGEGVDAIGVVVGSQAGSKSIRRCNLVSQLKHTENVFTYKAVEDLGFDVVAGNIVWRVRRSFDNLSPNPVNIWESGVYASGNFSDPTTGDPLPVHVMIALDVRDTPITVEPGQRLIVTYEFIFPVPTGWSL